MSSTSESPAATSLKRDCEAIGIPGGYRVTLPEGTPVEITQALGGSYTVRTGFGALFRIEGQDADALGEAVRDFPMEQPGAAPPGVAEGSVEAQVWQQLRTCYDPEIPVDIVELGLIYACRVMDAEGAGSAVEIDMTLTAPGCGMGEILKQEIERKVSAIPGVTRALVTVVLDPPWNPTRMSEAARLQLGFFY